MTTDLLTAPARPAELLRFATAGSVDDGKSTLQRAAEAGEEVEEAVREALDKLRVGGLLR